MIVPNATLLSGVITVGMAMGLPTAMAEKEKPPAASVAPGVSLTRNP